MTLPVLTPLPPGFTPTVASLHRVAERLLAPARKPDNEIALTATPGGFGTPQFEFRESRHQVRVEGDELVHLVGGEQLRAPLRNLAEAAKVIADLLPPGAAFDREPLAVDATSSRALGSWYRFGADVLGHLLAFAPAADAPTPPLLWPEHFDIAIELGLESEGRRANYGVSPGDEDHEEPYVYVGPWATVPTGELWGARGFNGAELGYAKLLEAADQRAAAIDFFEVRREALEA
jgi:hypothetical protein